MVLEQNSLLLDLKYLIQDTGDDVIAESQAGARGSDEIHDSALMFVGGSVECRIEPR